MTRDAQLEAPAGLSLQEYLAILRRRRGIILQTFVLITVVGIVVTLLTKPVYQASAQLLVDGPSLNVETEQNIFKRLPAPFRQFQAYALRHPAFLIARNQEAVQVARRKGYQGPTRVVGNAVDCGLFRPLPDAERRATRHEFGWGGDQTFVAGYVGRLVPEKGLADAVAALARMPGDARLALVGDGPMRAALEAQAARLGIADRVRFVGPKPLTDLPRVMNALDVLLLPSRTTARWKEQFGRVLIEAGACGTPVVGSDSGAIPEVIAGGGLVFPEGDVPALAGALGRLRADPAHRKALGDAGRTRAHALYGWDRVAAQMVEVYQEIAGRGPPAA